MPIWQKRFSKTLFLGIECLFAIFILHLFVSVNVLQVLKTRTSELSVGSSVFYIPRH